MDSKKDRKLDSYLFTAWAASVLAMFGSLYFSEIRQYEPCHLCWYQRILMYPLVLFLGLAVIRKDYRTMYYSRWLGSVGALLSAYHYSLQKIPFMTANAPSCGRIPCTAQYINWLGFISIPLLAFIAFVLIVICSSVVLHQLKQEEN